MRLARDPERNGFAAETEWTGRLLATEETQRRVGDFLAGVQALASRQTAGSAARQMPSALPEANNCCLGSCKGE